MRHGLARLLAFSHSASGSSMRLRSLALVCGGDGCATGDPGSAGMDGFGGGTGAAAGNGTSGFAGGTGGTSLCRTVAIRGLATGAIVTQHLTAMGRA